MKTAYIQRSTEDLNENMNVIREDVDLFLTNEKDGGRGPLEKLADLYCR